MGKIIRLTESDLIRIVKRVVKEQEEEIFGTHTSFSPKWVDKTDSGLSDADIEFTDVREFGPGEYEDFMEFINNCNTRWCIKTKHHYDRFAEEGNLKIGKGRRK